METSFWKRAQGNNTSGLDASRDKELQVCDQKTRVFSSVPEKLIPACTEEKGKDKRFHGLYRLPFIVYCLPPAVVSRQNPHRRRFRTNEKPW